MGYVELSLDQLITALEAGTRPKGGVRKYKEGIPSIGGEHLDSEGGFSFENTKYVPEAFFNSMKRGKLDTGDVLVVKDGATTGKTSIVRPGFPFEKAAVNEHVFLLRADRKRINPYYLFHFLRSRRGQRQILSRFKGSAQGGINRSFIKHFPIPLPSLPTQDRIVSILERVLFNTKEARQELSHIPAIVARLQMAILSRAYRGDLIKVASKKTDGNATKPNQELSELPVELPPLSKGWRWTILGNVVESMRNGIYKPAKFWGTGVPCLRMYNIQNGRISLHDLKRIDLSKDEKMKYLLKPGDILINRVNSPELLGKAAVIPSGLGDIVFEAMNIRLRVTEAVDPHYVVGFLRTSTAREVIEMNAKQTVGMASISQEEIRNLPFPLAPLFQQRQIIEMLNHIFLIQDNTIVEAKACIIMLRKLEESLLKNAFDGKLDNGSSTRVNDHSSKFKQTTIDEFAS